MHQILHLFADPFAFRQVLPDVWSGFLINVHMMLIAEGWCSCSRCSSRWCADCQGLQRSRCAALAITYTDFFRGTPLIIVAYAFIIGIPGLRYAGISGYSNEVYGIAALTVVYTAYVTEVYRAGIESVHGSQRMAARSLGLNYGQALRYVVLPQAIRRVIPPLLNDFIGLQKDTAIIGGDRRDRGRRASQQLRKRVLQLPGFLVAAVLFIYLTIPLARFTDHLIRERELRERAAMV